MVTHKYTAESFQKMPYEDVVSILKRAEERGAKDVCEWCKAELTRREPPPFQKHAPCAFESESSVREFEKQACEVLRSFAFELEKKFDFSEERASLLSKKKNSNFRAHKFLSTSAQPKTGGKAKDGSYSIDRYISWRIYDNIYSLTIILGKEAPASEARYHIYAPQEDVGANYKPISDLRKHHDDNDELGLVKGGAEYKTLNEAMDAFEQLMYKVAPRK